MGHGKQSKKKVVKYLKDWNGSRYLDKEEFCRISFKVNKNKVMIFASLVFIRCGAEKSRYFVVWAGK